MMWKKNCIFTFRDRISSCAEYHRRAVMCDNNRVPYEEVAALYENQISFHYVPIALIPETKDGRLCIQGYTFDKVLNVIDADISEKMHGIKIYQNTQALLQDVLPHRKYRLDGTCPALRREILIKDNVEMILLCNEGQDRIDTTGDTLYQYESVEWRI